MFDIIFSSTHQNLGSNIAITTQMKTFCQLACTYPSTQLSYSGVVYGRYAGAIDDHTNRALMLLVRKLALYQILPQKHLKHL